MRVKFLCRLSVSEKSYVPAVVLLLLTAVALSGCATTPARPEAQGVMFPQPIDVVQKAAVDALIVAGFDVQKSEPLYVEGFRPRKFGLFVGSGGETAGIWLEPVGSATTNVHVATAKSFVGILGQKDWDEAILEAMEKSLRKGQ